jgi:hypothetical protein
VLDVSGGAHREPEAILGPVADPERQVPRVPGIAVFVARLTRDIPPVVV